MHDAPVSGRGVPQSWARLAPRGHCPTLEEEDVHYNLAAPTDARRTYNRRYAAVLTFLMLCSFPHVHAHSRMPVTRGRLGAVYAHSVSHGRLGPRRHDTPQLRGAYGSKPLSQCPARANYKSMRTPTTFGVSRRQRLPEVDFPLV